MSKWTSLQQKVTEENSITKMSASAKRRLSSERSRCQGHRGMTVTCCPGSSKSFWWGFVKDITDWTVICTASGSWHPHQPAPVVHGSTCWIVRTQDVCLAHRGVEFFSVALLKLLNPLTTPLHPTVIHPSIHKFVRPPTTHPSIHPCNSSYDQCLSRLLWRRVFLCGITENLQFVGLIIHQPSHSTSFQSIHPPTSPPTKPSIE